MSRGFLGRKASPTYLWPALCLIIAALWLVFAKFVVPPIIESAYYGKSLSFLNSRIHGQTVHSVGFYLQLWDRLATRVLVSWLGFSLLAILMSSEAFFQRCVGEATPGTLGAIRMWTCAILLVTTCWDDLSGI